MEKAKVRRLKTYQRRMETGAIRFGDDWPGLFIRGDDCIWLLGIFTKLVGGADITLFDVNFLDGLKEEIEQNVLLK